MSDAYQLLLEAARRERAVPPAETLVDMDRFLSSVGGQAFDPGSGIDDLADEFTDRSMVAQVYTITDDRLLSERASAEEREMFADEDEPFDPLEYGPEQAEWTRILHEMETLKRLVIIVERSKDDPARVGGFRVHGAGQWLRESLWAASGVVPRDPGSPSPASGRFAQAFIHVGRAPFESDPLA